MACRLPSRRPCTYPSKVPNTSTSDTYLGNAERGRDISDRQKLKPGVRCRFSPSPSLPLIKYFPFLPLLTPDLEAQTID
jgi:hypothetical protein